MTSEFHNVNFTQAPFCRKNGHKAWIMDFVSTYLTHQWGRVKYRFSDIEMPCEQEARLFGNLSYIKK